MGSKPITQRAGTKYTSAPPNQEVTVDPEGTTPARFARMSPVKQVQVIGTGTVRDDENNELNATANERRLSGGVQVIKGGTKTQKVLNTPTFTPEGDAAYAAMTPEQRAAADARYRANEANYSTETVTEPDQTIQLPDTTEVSFDYKPIIQNVDTETLKQSKRRNRITRGSGRRAEADDRRADRLESRLDKLAKKAGTTRDEITEEEKSNRYKRLERKYNIKRQVADASKARFEQNVEFSKSGVNPYNTRRTEQSKKASEDTQTKSEFESKFGGNNMGIQEIKSFTPSSINFSSPTMPSSSRSASDFTGSGSYLNRMAGNSLEFPDGAVSGNEGNLWNPKGMPKKGNVNRGYKMGGYGTKNK